MNEDLRTILTENECILVVGFDDCCITHTVQPIRAVYSVAGIIGTLVQEHDMTEEDAWEHFYYNIIGARPNTDTAPVFVNDMMIMEEYNKMEQVVETTQDILRRSSE